MIEEEKQLSIGLFEENPAQLTILQLFLTLAGHSVSVCSEGGNRLAAWLSLSVESAGEAGLSPYDLLIVDVAEGAILLDKDVFTCLKHIALRQIPPLIVLTASQSSIYGELLRYGRVEVLPFRDEEQMPCLFQNIEHLTAVPSPLSPAFLLRAQRQLRELLQPFLHSKLGWLSQRHRWLSQQQEWLEQRASWLSGRRAWLEQRRKEPACQHEWVEEQLAWVEQQEQEVSQEQRRLMDRKRWLSRMQSILDEPEQPPLQEAQ